MITVHHLGISQSERIVWLFEELGIEYKLVLHTRDPVLSPESLRALPGNRTGKAPFIEDVDAGIFLSESGAICEYVARKYANGKLTLNTNDKDFSEYLYWLHYANGTLLPSFITEMFLAGNDIPSDSMMKQFSKARLEAALEHIDDRLRDNKWLAGTEFTLADIMTVYVPTTQRYFGPQISLEGYNNILRWLKDCTTRPGYQRAMQKGDPGMKILNGAEPPPASLLAAGGTLSDIWKK